MHDPATSVSGRSPDPSTPRRGGKPPKLEPLAAKVPAIGAMFWIIKLITTGVGEAASDFMGNTFIPLAVVVGVGGMWLAFRWQLRAREYHAPTYWFTVMMVAVFGTMVADGIKDGTGISYSITTPFFAVVVGVIFWRWYRSEGTLSIHSITTRRREAFYWSAVLGTFALGTAAGDLTAIQLNIGFWPSAALFAGVMAVPAIAWKLGLNPIAAFWLCYVVTRPLGASFADGFSKTHAESGLGLGDGLVSVIGIAVFAVLVAYVARTKGDIQDPAEAHAYDHAPFPHADHLHEQVHPEEQARAAAAAPRQPLAEQPQTAPR
ncbi:MAG: hypothetical protein AAGC46_02340 [Solirubrobacteraceae bacterium]|nr:hypothetical protein [Patulibacter sp.]